jgi:hypothetical protein
VATSLKQYVLVQDKQGNTFVVPVSGGRDLGDFKDMIEDEIGVDTRGTVLYMSLTELRRRAKAGEMD